jgi:hypothetical protein
LQMGCGCLWSAPMVSLWGIPKWSPGSYTAERLWRRRYAGSRRCGSSVLDASMSLVVTMLMSPASGRRLTVGLRTLAALTVLLRVRVWLGSQVDRMGLASLAARRTICGHETVTLA